MGVFCVLSFLSSANAVVLHIRPDLVMTHPVDPTEVEGAGILTLGRIEEILGFGPGSTNPLPDNMGVRGMVFKELALSVDVNGSLTFVVSHLEWT